MLKLDPLFRVEAAAIADEAFSAMRHDLRNKLGSIRTASFYLKRKFAPTEVFQQDSRIGQFLQLIEDEAIRANDIISQAKTPLHRNPSKLLASTVIDRAAACMRVETPELISLELFAEQEYIKIDPDDAALALRCLLENAVEAMNGQGNLQLTATRVENRLQFLISDEGPGIPTESHEQVLTAFHTTKLDHMGLGLNIARRIALRYDGGLSFLPAERGACVSLSFPVCP
jgi:signal transduction histidine kinase